jgi:MarR family transcriptional regulator, organic hydroperoxide resistance regulator
MAQLNNQTIEDISENVIGILPVILKKLISFIDEGTNLELSHYHFAILGMISKFGPLSVSEIGRRLLISKPQMTAMLDKIVDYGLVSRTQIPEDRRVVIISLTSEGRKVLNRAIANLQSNVAVKMAKLSESDLQAFSEALKTIKDIGNKID